MSVQRKRYSAENAQRASCVLWGASQLDHPMEEAGSGRNQYGFSGGRARRERTDEALLVSLYREIGQLKMEIDWLKKSQLGVWKRRGR